MVHFLGAARLTLRLLLSAILSAALGTRLLHMKKLLHAIVWYPYEQRRLKRLQNKKLTTTKKEEEVG